jgi:DUF1680 family protein
VALMRGPLVYCLEGVDNPAPLHRMRLPAGAALTPRFEDVLGGIVMLEGSAEADRAEDWAGALYRTEPPRFDAVSLKAAPYFAWDNREPGEMEVWVREG